MTAAEGSLPPTELRPETTRRMTVAVVGRPNVGKSALFNRIAGRRDAIVEERPGVTRDRKGAVAEWCGRQFELVDTGGWVTGGDALDRQVSAQAERAMQEADLVLLVCDVAVGVTAPDEAVARLLRRRRFPAIVVVNKVDSANREADGWAFSRLGLGPPAMVSALHGRGSGDLLDRVIGELQAAEGGPAEGPRTASAPAEQGGDHPGQAAPPPVAEPDLAERAAGAAVVVVGRPNVGKSTLFNRLVGDERSIVHERPGTTRDSVDTVVEIDGERLRFVDTAGMRRPARVDSDTEYYSTLRALAAVDQADVALFLIDATEGVTHQDQRLAERVDAAGCPIVIVLNKWELVQTAARDVILGDVGDRLAFLAYAPVLKVSALTGKGVHRLVPAIEAAMSAYRRRVPTSQVNRVVQSAQSAHPAPRGRVRFAVQGATDPPTFTLFADGDIPATWLRYVERSIREAFDFGPTPIKVRVRRRGRR
jgi:GTPase